MSYCSEIHAEAADDIGKIALTLAQVRVFDAIEHGAQMIEDLLKRPFGIDALFFDDRGRSRKQHRVVHHQPLSLEQRAEIRARQPDLNTVELLSRLQARTLEPLEFGVDPRRCDGKAEHLRPLNQHHGPPCAHAA